MIVEILLLRRRLSHFTNAFALPILVVANPTDALAEQATVKFTKTLAAPTQPQTT